MSRRGNDARARDRRHRAAVALRSQTSANSEVERQSNSPSGEQVQREPGHAPPTTSKSASTPSTWNSIPATPPKRAPRKRVDVDVATLRQLVVDRKAAAMAVDVEVQRLRRLGAGWAQIATGLGVSRQAARQRFMDTPDH